jgi:hypothetical protein
MRFAEEQRVFVIGIKPEEHTWVRLLVDLLRNRDPLVAELARQALLYLETTANQPPGAAAAQ